MYIGHCSFPFPYISPTFVPKVSALTLVPSTIPAAEKAGKWEITTMKCFRFLWHQPPEPTTLNSTRAS